MTRRYSAYVCPKKSKFCFQTYAEALDNEVFQQVKSIDHLHT
ncbi:hypothetical protein PENVUL_c002G07635 [Penicillium vulpinum]|uniref:Uncharacterized protein n=1 Tax=Penicillium vulpinum TaxID=29845 RepID=A0A1V6SCX8_9EURO|nr:hypothetical protein PENVUL_c002G07635 [Penicillium vulpinum]